jgi:hypothetical protein
VRWVGREGRESLVRRVSRRARGSYTSREHGMGRMAQGGQRAERHHDANKRGEQRRTEDRDIHESHTRAWRVCLNGNRPRGRGSRRDQFDHTAPVVACVPGVTEKGVSEPMTARDLRKWACYYLPRRLGRGRASYRTPGEEEACGERRSRPQSSQRSPSSDSGERRRSSD